MVFEFYKNKKVLITGHTGFKGGWLALWLLNCGAKVVGYSLESDTNPSFFKAVSLDNQINSIIGDIRDKDKLNKVFIENEPEIVFHLAAQPLVRESYMDPIYTYETNVLGTLNVLEAARRSQCVKAFLNVTTDKCYKNIEKNYSYKETDQLGGYDMYSSSKACSEILTESYRNSFLSSEDSFALASARSGNIIGGGDWSNDRLVPDCVKSILNKKPIVIRNPDSVRPWQYVLDSLFGYMLLVQKLYSKEAQYCTSFNFGPYDKIAHSVSDLVEELISVFGEGEIEVQSDDAFHEANLLKLNTRKTENMLCWKSKYQLEKAIEETAHWYLEFYKGRDMLDLSLFQIKKYELSS